MMKAVAICTLLLPVFAVTVSAHGSMEKDKDIASALAARNLSWIPEPMKLTVEVEIEFESPALQYDVCCKNIEVPKRSFKLDPTGKSKVTPVDTRTEGTSREVSLEMSDGTSTFEGKHYTLLMVDPDVPVAAVGTVDRPLVHWLIINIPGKQVENGTTLHAYRGPAPPDDKPHYYYYLLYEQQDTLTLTNTEAFSVASCRARPGTCLFDVSKFTVDNKLTLVGATWMISEHSFYVKHMHIAGGKSSDEVCEGVEGYANPCPASTATICSPEVFFLLLASLAMLFA